MSNATPLDHAEYVSLRSWRRDGTPVDTPVWCAPLDGKLVVFSLRESHKVKRVRRNAAVQLAKCDVRGKVLGSFFDGRCRIVDDQAEEARAYAALIHKYGWKMRFGNVLSTLSGRIKRRVVLEIALASQAASNSSASA